MERRHIRLTLSLLMLLALAWPVSFVHATTVTRDVKAFTDAQGSTFEVVPPVGDFIGWTSCAEEKAAVVDYAGVAARYLISEGRDLHTTMAGSVVERPLASGQVEVTVNLHTKNALSWVIPYDCDDTVTNQFGENPLLFGYRAPQVLAGAKPALGDSHLVVVFTMDAGRPMPDLTIDVLGGQRPDVALVSIYFTASATGTLANGTPAHATVVQTGILFRSKFLGATADGFPAERVALQPIGR